jgi:hypothetical protein
MAEEQEETFASFITTQYRKGHLNDQATAAFRAVVDAVVMTRKAGQVAVVIDIKPEKDADHLNVSGKVTSKVPESDHSGVFWPDRGWLARSDPNQQRLPGMKDQ